MLTEDEMAFAVQLGETLAKLKTAADGSHPVALDAREVQIVVRGFRVLSRRGAGVEEHERRDDNGRQAEQGHQA